MKQRLSPAQLESLEELRSFAKPGEIVLITGAAGMGKSSLLRAFAEETQGDLLTMSHFMEWQRDAHPLRLEETLEWLLTHHLAQTEVVLFDDLHRLLAVTRSAQYPRKGYIDAALAEIPRMVEEEGRTLVVVCSPPSPFKSALSVEMPALNENEAQFFLSRWLNQETLSFQAGDLLSAVESLNLHQLKALAGRIKVEPSMSFEVALEHLQKQLYQPSALEETL